MKRYHKWCISHMGLEHLSLGATARRLSMVVIVEYILT